MVVLSLFDGISCARVALERLGYKDIIYLASEVDKYAIQIAQKNFPDTIQLGDITQITREMLPEQIDLFIGGSPCQDLSIAKANRKGLDGERSCLFWHWVRLWNECKPKYWVLENVNSMPKEARHAISDILNVEPIMINAALVSAQNRKRLFWTNIQTDFLGFCDIPQPEDRGILLKDILESGIVDDRMTTTTGKAFNLTSSYQGAQERHSVQRHARTMVAEPIRVGEIGKGGQGQRIYSSTGKSVALSANGGGQGAKTGLYAFDKPKIIATQLNQSSKFGNQTSTTGKVLTLRTNHPHGIIIIPEATKLGYAIAERGDGIDLSYPKSKTRRGRVLKSKKAPTLMAGNGNVGVFNGYVIRKLTPIECERLQSLPDNYTEGISNTQRYKCLGNAFNVEVVKHILSYM